MIPSRDHVEALFARGRAYLAAGRWQDAHHDFSDAAARLPRVNARVTACIAHCNACGAQPYNDRLQFGAAALFYERALSKGLSSAAVHNDLAFCRMKLGQLDAAELHAREAIRHDESIPSADHILVIVDRRKALQGSRLPNLPYLTEALRRCPQRGELLLDVACSYALAARWASRSSQPEEAARRVHVALDCCQRAIEQGVAPGRLEQAAYFYDVLRLESRYREMARSPASTINAAPTTWLVDPLAGLEDPASLHGR